MDRAIFPSPSSINFHGKRAWTITVEERVASKNGLHGCS